MTNLADMPTGFALNSDERPWTMAASVDRVPLDRGVAVLVDNIPVALFHLSPLGEHRDEWHAVSHVDPLNGVPVMARGLIGSQDQDGELIATIASPLNKRRYDVATGRCLDSDSAPLRVFEVLIADNAVLVR